MHLPSFGNGKQIPVTFSFAGKEQKGTLSEVHGTEYWWFLHSAKALIDILQYENGSLQFQKEVELNRQKEHFAAVLLGWYQ